jgi:SnoaL-like domain
MAGDIRVGHIDLSWVARIRRHCWSGWTPSNASVGPRWMSSRHCIWAMPGSANSTTFCRAKFRTVEMWELVAREQIRDTLARYNWSGDAGRLDDLADTFCADGVLEIRGLEVLRGRSEIVAFLGGVTGRLALSADIKPIVRHNVANVLFNEVTRDQAQVSCYFSVVTHIGLDHVGRYRDTLVPDGDTWRIKHRKVSTDWAAPDSAMAR